MQTIFRADDKMSVWLCTTEITPKVESAPVVVEVAKASTQMYWQTVAGVPTPDSPWSLSLCLGLPGAP